MNRDMEFSILIMIYVYIFLVTFSNFYLVLLNVFIF